MVGEGGLEPPHPFGHRNLNPARLPIPPLARVTARPPRTGGSGYRTCVGRLSAAMGLQQFERRLERLVEGVFAKAFRSGLQPVEVGRRITREMDLGRTVGVRGVDRAQPLHASRSTRATTSGSSATRRRCCGSWPTPPASTPATRATASSGPVDVELETANVGAGHLPRRRRGARRARAAVPTPRWCWPTAPGSSWARTRSCIGRLDDCEIQLSRQEREPAPRRGAPRGRRVRAGRPRLDQRHQGQRRARQATGAGRRRRDHRGRQPPALRDRAEEPPGCPTRCSTSSSCSSSPSSTSSSSACLARRSGSQVTAPAVATPVADATTARGRRRAAVARLRDHRAGRPARARRYDLERRGDRRPGPGCQVALDRPDRVAAPRPRSSGATAALRRGPRLVQRHVRQPQEGVVGRGHAPRRPARASGRRPRGHPVRLALGGASPTSGRVRPNNEDSVLAEEPLFAVADGMGGHAAGEVASQTRHRGAARQLRARPDAPTAWSTRCTTANARRAGTGPSDDADLRGMGTTLTAAAPRRARTARRSSRSSTSATRAATCFRDGELEQITEDHSLVEEMVRGRPAHARGGRSTTRSATSSPASSAWRTATRRRRSRSTASRSSPTAATACCSPATASPTRSPTSRSRRCCAGSPTPTTRRASWSAWPTTTAATTTSPSSSIDVVDDDDKAGAASEALAGEPAATRPPTTLLSRTSAAQRSADPDRSPTAAEPPSAAAGGGRRPRLDGCGWSGSSSRSCCCSFLAVVAITWYARGSYYVGVRRRQRHDLPGPARRLPLGRPHRRRPHRPRLDRGTAGPPATTSREGQPEPTLGAARRYIANLREEAKRAGAARRPRPPPSTRRPRRSPTVAP